MFLLGRINVKPLVFTMKRERKILISAFLILILFVLFINLNIQKQNARIKNLRTVFDDKLTKFDIKVFERAVPYINKLVDHYGYTKIESEGYSETIREYDESVNRYVLNSKIENFKIIGQVLEEIRRKNLVNTLRELINLKAGPLALAIFFLSPLPTTFKSNSQPQILASETIMKDNILKYLAVLMSANIYRGIFTTKTWFELYDEEKFINQYGNVLSITDKSISTGIPELKLSKHITNFHDFDEILNDSQANYKVIELKSKLRLDLSIKDFVLDSKVENYPDILIINTLKNSTYYYTQIPEQIEIKEIKYLLKAMIVIRKNQEVLMVFNEDFQFWNMFHGENVLSIPRPFARKYFTEHGRRLIYAKY